MGSYDTSLFLYEKLFWNCLLIFYLISQELFVYFFIVNTKKD